MRPASSTSLPPPRLPARVGRSGSFQAGSGWAAMADDGDGKLKTERRGGSGRPEVTAAATAAGSWLGGGDLLLNVTLLALVALVAYQLYRRWGKRNGAGGAARQSQAVALPRMKRRDFTLEQLREYDGAHSARILLAVNGKVFDVTKGSKFYGPGEEGRLSALLRVSLSLPPPPNPDAGS